MRLKQEMVGAGSGGTQPTVLLLCNQENFLTLCIMNSPQGIHSEIKREEGKERKDLYDTEEMKFFYLM